MKDPKAPAGPPNPAPSPAPAPAPAVTKCPGCDGALEASGYCRTCDARVDADGDLVPVGLLGRVAALEGDADRNGKLVALVEKFTGTKLDALDVETFQLSDLLKKKEGDAGGGFAAELDGLLGKLFGA